MYASAVAYDQPAMVIIHVPDAEAAREDTPGGEDY